MPCEPRTEGGAGRARLRRAAHAVGHALTHVLVLHKNESVELGVTVGVFEMAGVAANVALRLP